MVASSKEQRVSTATTHTRRVPSPRVACSGTHGPLAPILPAWSCDSSCISQFFLLSRREVKAGRERVDAFPAPSLPSQLQGNTGLVLPGLRPGWRRGRRRTLTIPRQIHCGSKSLPCSTSVDIPPTARATAWKMSVVLERGAAGSAEPFTRGASWPVGTHSAASAAAGLDPQPSPGTVPLVLWSRCCRKPVVPTALLQQG